MEKEKLREIVKKVVEESWKGNDVFTSVENQKQSLIEALHQALIMSGVLVSPCDHSDTYPLNQKYSKCRKCGGCIED